MDSSDVTQLIILLILLLLSGFFSSAETALTTVNKIRLRYLAEEGNKRAATTLKITENSGKMLSAILIGNNIVNLSASSLTTSLAYNLGGPAVAIASVVLTVLILLFGEITPKTLASIHSEKLALLYAPVIDIFMKVMTPVIFVINSLSNLVMLILRIDPNAKMNTMTENELRIIVDVSHEDGVIESEEKEMIYNVFDLGDAKAKDVMVPRINVTFADIDSSYAELIDLFREDKFTRLPVYAESKDNVVGTINMKDLLLFDNNQKDFHVKDILREAYFTYEYKNISELLVEMRTASFNIAIVLDEYDENEEENIRQINALEYIVEGSTNLDDLNDSLDLQLESEDYDSVGGFIIEHLDRLPEEMDEITTPDGIRMVVEKLDKNRIEQVHIYLPEPDSASSATD